MPEYNEDIEPIVIEPPKEKADATFIFLHGLGDEGSSYRNVAEQFHGAGRLATTRFVFPTASYIRDVGERAWYTPVQPSSEDPTGDAKDYEAAIEVAESLIRHEEKAGIPRSRIVLGGFSQGGAITHLWSILNQKKEEERLAAIVCTATYVPMRGRFAELCSEEAKSVIKGQKLLVLHGQSDSLVPMWVAEKGRPILEELGFDVKFAAPIPGMSHNLTGFSLAVLCSFLESVLEPEKEALKQG